MTIYERLAQLEDENPEPIFEASFLNFIELIKDDVKDNLIISLTPDNEIYATWQRNKNHCPQMKHCLLFKTDGIIKYVTR